MKNHLQAQALLELAIFGSIIIMLIGILLNYGLRNNFQQRLQQQTYRKALAASQESGQNNKPSSVAYLQVEDKHVVNPSDTWGLGTVYPFQAQASVTKSGEGYKSPDNVNELPVLRINIQDRSVGEFTTSGFRVERDVDGDTLEKYNHIFGGTAQVCRDGVTCSADSPDNWLKVGDDGVGKRCAVAEILDPNNNLVCPDNNYIYNQIRLIDQATGQIIDYDSAVSQCRQIINTGFCKQECEKTKPKDVDNVIPDDQEINCTEVCERVMNPPNQNTNSYDSNLGGAWYCAGYSALGGGAVNNTNALQQYDFPVLDRIFSFTPLKEKSMGIQPQSTQWVQNQSSLRKTEGELGITTQDNVNYRIITEREIRSRPANAPEADYTQSQVHYNTVDVDRTKTETTSH